MSVRPPDFDELAGNAPPGERDRLRHVHDLLVEAGPPPELPPELDAVQWPEEALAPLGLTRRAHPTRKRSPLLLAATLATIAVAAFLVGQATSPSSTSIDAVAVVKMHGTSLARDATASIELGRAGADGNWPMVLNVTGLRPLPRGGYYELYLSREGKPVAPCGSFNVDRDETTVRLSAAYDLKSQRWGWVVTRHLPGQPHTQRPVVMRT